VELALDAEHRADAEPGHADASEDEAERGRTATLLIAGVARARDRRRRGSARRRFRRSAIGRELRNDLDTLHTAGEGRLLLVGNAFGLETKAVCPRLHECGPAVEPIHEGLAVELHPNLGERPTLAIAGGEDDGRHRVVHLA